MENTYKSYENQYTANTLALNKHQHNEERGKRQHLSHKFSLTPLSDFKWGGNVHGNKVCQHMIDLIINNIIIIIIYLFCIVLSPYSSKCFKIKRNDSLLTYFHAMLRYESNFII